MVFSKATGYGIRALAFLARSPEPRLCGLQEIADNEQIPSVYLRKVLGELRRHRFLRSAKGIHGGYELLRTPQTITIWEIFCILDHEPYFDQCLLGHGPCSEKRPCALCGDWQHMRGNLVKMMQSTTIADVVAQDALRPAEILDSTRLASDSERH